MNKSKEGIFCIFLLLLFQVLRLSKKSFDNDITGFKEFALSVLEYLKDDSEYQLQLLCERYVIQVVVI